MPKDDNVYADDLNLAVRLAREAGEVALSHYGRVERLTKTHSATTDEAVTVADRAAQRVIVGGLRAERSGDGIIGEESDTGESITADNLQPDGRNWVIDPIDGTNNFIAGLGNWAICVGLLDAGHPVAGVVYDVTRGVLYAGAAGVGAFANDVPVRVVDTGWSAASLLMLTSSLEQPDGLPPAWLAGLFYRTNWKIRMLGSATLEAALVGAGVAHGAITLNGKLWDCVAPAAFTLAAGGQVVRPDGGALFPYDVEGYRGARVPFITTAAQATPGLVAALT